MLAGFAPSPVVGFAVGSFACSPSSHMLAPRGSATLVGASIPAARRGRASTLRCSLDPGSAQSSRRQLMTIATVGLMGALASTAGAEDTAPTQKVGVVDKMKGKVTSKVSEAQSGGVAGVSVSVVKQTVLYPIDTVKCRLQSRPLAAGESPWGRRDLFKGLYSGFLFPLVCNAPAGGVFFATKDTVKDMFVSKGPILSTLFGIAAGSVPFWLVKQPSEVIKVRSQTKELDGKEWPKISPSDPSSILSLFTGIQSNVAYSFPADMIKFVIYDAAKAKMFGKVAPGPLAAALLGAASNVVSAVAVTPVDVARTRIMAGTAERGNTIRVMTKIARDEGPKALLLGLYPRMARSVVSGGLQFATYEYTKQAAKG
ncbi:mitochondrial carrier domain-containing protein [Baffinella frigidus]|nr:mitochondrial carrier domain-containing protein [Cryptophyta sp. CCMP2293]